ncbi:antibiotic biosynthesis monooxygenase family protein [Staphylospora marina]|uniref:antibiotic biosynthesis monooxygenase family protein n=1 Tax=Staphylospora marina TaxID=2490858 RepID=UPI0013DDD6E7|nr:antibiotic biosynthesis monooxygenase family protein [Staphylospora marina]
MYQVNNRIDIRSPEHLAELKERFAKAPESMKQVPGFISFRLLEAEDGSHVIAETVFDSPASFRTWLESDHFRNAHGGRSGNAGGSNPARYFVVIG